jgi:outer membrane protein TolC
MVSNMTGESLPPRRTRTDTLKKAADCLKAGLADTLELGQAREFLATSAQDYIRAINSHQLARAALACATGAAVQSIH